MEGSFTTTTMQELEFLVWKASGMEIMLNAFDVCLMCAG